MSVELKTRYITDNKPKLYLILLQYQRILEYNGQDTLPDSWWGTLAPTPSANR